MVNTLLKQLRRFKNDKRGMAPIIGIIVLTILFFPLMYFTLGYAFDQVIAPIDATFTGIAEANWEFAKLCISLSPLIVAVGALIYGSVNAKLRSYEE